MHITLEGWALIIFVGAVYIVARIVGRPQHYTMQGGHATATASVPERDTSGQGAERRSAIGGLALIGIAVLVLGFVAVSLLSHVAVPVAAPVAVPVAAPVAEPITAPVAAPIAVPEFVKIAKPDAWQVLGPIVTLLVVAGAVIVITALVLKRSGWLQPIQPRAPRPLPAHLVAQLKAKEQRTPFGDRTVFLDEEDEVTIKHR